MTPELWFLLAVGLCGLSLYLYVAAQRLRHAWKIARLRDEYDQIYADAVREERQRDLVAFQLRARRFTNDDEKIQARGGTKGYQASVLPHRRTR